MSRNYLIGVGGTGARVIEAIVHCCAAGGGPRDLSILIVDPDKGNGNLSRTNTLIATYQECRKSLSQRTSSSELFGTEISTAPSNFVWDVLPGTDQTLADFIDYKTTKTNNRDLAALMDLLFTPAELKEPLNEGFRGHPSIGAVAMSNVERGENPWKKFWDDLQNSQGEHDVRVFLVGSIFGGTGAAGVPTFGASEMLKFNELAVIRTDPSRGSAGSTTEKGRSKILLGGALVLPYFTIDMTQEGRSPEANRLFVTAADFPIATKAALQYYAEKKLAFDQLYLIGDSLNQAVGAFSSGNQTQENRPHYIELVSALAAFDFFRQDVSKVTGQQEVFVACRDARTVDWDGLPVSRDAALVGRLQSELKLRLSTMTVFAYALDTLGRETLARDHRQIKEAWYNKAFTFTPSRREDSAKDPRSGQAALDMVMTFCERFLRWISDMDDAGGEVNLVSRSMLYSADNHLLEPNQHKTNVGGLLKEHDGAGLDFDSFDECLRTVVPAAKNTGAVDRYVSLFYEAASEFAKRNWRIASGTPA